MTMNERLANMPGIVDIQGFSNLFGQIHNGHYEFSETPSLDHPTFAFKIPGLKYRTTVTFQHFIIHLETLICVYV